MNIRTIVALSALPFIVSGGCSYVGTGEKRPQLSPVEAATEAPRAGRWLGTHFEDIPIPQEFTLDYGSSYLNVSERGPRVADLRYTGQAPLTDVLIHVERVMPRAGWRSTSLTGVAIKAMRYVKGDEECELLVHEGDGGGSVIMVRLHPRQ